MGKKIKCILLICSIIILIIILFSLYYYNRTVNEYKDWQSVALDDIGTIKVPGSWVITRKNDIVYFTDKPINESNYKIFLVGDEYNGYVQVFGKIKLNRVISSEIFSNGASHGLCEFVINGKAETKYIIELIGVSKRIALFSWDNLVDENTLIKIAKSFSVEI